MRPFRFSCPRCGKVYTIKRAEHVGRRMRCTGCNSASVIRCARPVDVSTGIAAAAAVAAVTGGAALLRRLPERTGGSPLAAVAACGARIGGTVRAACPDVPALGNDETFVIKSPFAVDLPAADTTARPAPGGRARESFDVIEEILRELPEFTPGKEPPPELRTEPPQSSPVARAGETAESEAAASPAVAEASAKPAVVDGGRVAAPTATSEKSPVFDEPEGESMLAAAMKAKLLAEALPVSDDRDESAAAAARRAALSRKAARPDVVVPSRLLAPMPPVSTSAAPSASPPPAPPVPVKPPTLPAVTAGFKPPPVSRPAARAAIPVDEDCDDELEFGDTVAADAMPFLSSPEPTPAAVPTVVKPAVLHGDGSSGPSRWTVVAMAATLAAGGLAAALGWLLLMTDGRVLDTAAVLLP